jgi:hypothetical protein
MNFNDAELAVLASGIQRIGVFFRLAVEPDPVRVWLGAGKIKSGVNVRDPDGAVYRGFGELPDVPEINQMINGAAQRVEFILSGVSGRVLSIASGSDAQQVKGKDVAAGFGIFAPNWSLLGAVHWLAVYTADFVSVQQAATDDPLAPIVRTVTLSGGSLMTGRRRPARSYFTHQDQTARFPGDFLCVFVPRYAHGFNKPWPTFPA